jgi:hypothetical protein
VSGSTGHSVSISGRTGGTTTIGGSISDNGTGIVLSSNTGATINFSGKLTASTGADAAFTATGGGTVAATGSGSTLTTTTATALDVENTTIGSNGLNFQSISAGTTSSGPARGITLISTGTSGGLSVTGSGSSALGGDGSGGTIQHTSSSGSASLNSSDGGVYLSSTSDVSLADMSFASNHANGVYGTSVSGLDLSSDAFSNNGTSVSADDAGLRVDGLTGTSAITNTNISGSRTDNARIYGGGAVGAAAALTLSVTGSSFSGTHTPGSGSGCALGTSDQGDGLLVEPEDGNASVTATGDTFNGNYLNGLEVNGAGDGSDTATIGLTAENNTVENNCGAGIVVSDSDNGTAGGSPAATFTVDNNTVTGQQGDGIVANNFGGGTWTGHIHSNTVGSAGTVDSGSLGGSGIAVDDENSGTLTADVSSNTISQIENGFGIDGSAETGAPTLNLALTGNTIYTDQPNSQDGITVQSGAAAADTSVVCLNATNNTSVSAGTGVLYGYDSVGMSVGEFDNSPNATFDIQGPTADDPTTIQNYLNAHNTLGGTGRR